MRGGPAGAARRPGSHLLVVGLVLGLAAVLPPALRWADAAALDRYILALLPFALLLQAAAATLPPAPWRLAARTALVPVLAAHVSAYAALATGAPIAYGDDPTFAYLAGQARPGDVLLFSDPQRRARYRLGGGALPTAVAQTAVARYLLVSPAQADATVAALIPRYRRIWYVESSQRATAGTLVPAPLSARAYFVEQRSFDSPRPELHQFLATTLRLYATDPPDTARRLDATFGGKITLETAAYTGLAAPGRSLELRLRWRADRPPAPAYTVVVHLVDASGRLVAQHDGPPVNGLHPTGGWAAGEEVDDRRGVPLPGDLRPGEYRLKLGLYRGPERLALPDGASAITLGPVSVG